MRSILIVGGTGQMGKRYQACLRYLQRDYTIVDERDSLENQLYFAKEADGILIATPTATHAEMIRRFAPVKKPILCEKPVTKNTRELKELLKLVESEGAPFRMMCQYERLVDKSRIGRSKYDYFRHGSDGLYWDCLQIIGLARGEVTLAEQSPIWNCWINGKSLNLQHMDAAYLGYLQLWFQKPGDDLGWIQAIHEKTADMAAVGA